MNDLVISQVTLSAVAVVVMQWLKKASWFPWLTEQSGKIQNVVAAFTAAIVAIGVHYTYDSTTATLTITGISWAALGHGVWHWLQSYTFQETIYQAAFKPAGPHPLPDAPSK